MRWVTDGSKEACMSSVRFHTYRAPCREGEARPQPTALSPTPLPSPCCVSCTGQPPSPGASPAIPAPGSSHPSWSHPGCSHVGTQGLGPPWETCTFGLHLGSPGNRGWGMWVWGLAGPVPLPPAQPLAPLPKVVGMARPRLHLLCPQPHLQTLLTQIRLLVAWG